MKIKMKLNSASVEQALAQVKKYEQGLEEKAERLRRRVAEELRDLVEEGFNGSTYDDILYEGARVPNVKVETWHFTSRGGEGMSVVVAHGKEAVFAEFGAGVYYNPGGSPNPLNAPGVVAIGTYGKGHGSRKIWGWYDDPENKKGLHLTHGTPASMPMYHAIQEISRRLPAIAREVFSEG